MKVSSPNWTSPLHCMANISKKTIHSVNSCKKNILFLRLVAYKYGSWWQLFEIVSVWNSSSLTCKKERKQNHSQFSLHRLIGHLWIKKTQLDTGSLSAIHRSQCITYPTFYPVVLVWTLPITDATQWISRITDHNITVDEELKKVWTDTTLTSFI